jgi:hypothetical protein
MTVPSNLNKTSVRTDLTTNSATFFNNYYQPGFVVSGSANELVIGYFEKITNNRASAELLASSVIYTSMVQNSDPLQVVERLKNLEDREALAYITMFLNLNRVGSSFLGLHNKPRTSKYVSRLIRP